MHIHSKYSAATSEIMDLEHISYYSSFKGLDIVGTGDVLQPKWLAELREKLRENGGLFSLKGRKGAPLFLLSGEVSTIYEYGGKKRRVHHVILYPSFDAVRQVSDSLKSYGDLQSNGRPILSLSSEELASLVRELDENIELFPAHIWTPHYSIFGLHGHSSIQEAYGSEWRRIHLLETGLSCYDSKTEVLTDNGWKKFSEVRHSDKICSLNLKNGGVEFQNPMGMFVYRYEGKMYRLKTKTIDLLVTPNHKLLYSPCDFRRPKPFRLREAQFLFNRSKRFKKDGIWRGKNERYFTLPAVKIRHGSRYYSGFRT